MDFTEAQQLFKDKFRVMYQFDGKVTTDQNTDVDDKKRAVGWGGDKDTFTWKRFITLEDDYNPTPGQLNPWSLKNWYKWGCRKFHFHCPFGKVALGSNQQLVYEVDQFLSAKNGLIIDGQVQNTPMPWLTADFVDVIKALTTGKQGYLDSTTWNSWTTGKDAWFNPAEPIDLIVYIGAMADISHYDHDYSFYIDRWNKLFKASPKIGLDRLKQSVSPLIRANCKIAFDACVESAGPIPGEHIPYTRQTEALQKGWWSFWTWLNKTIGKDRIYVESYPFKKNGKNNPYLGYNVISDDDWSYTPNVQPGPNGPHMTSEMGSCEFWRAIWQNAPQSTPLISIEIDGIEEPQRYSFLSNCGYAVKSKETNQTRLQPSTCCAPNHNYYYSSIYGDIAAYHILNKQNTRYETNVDGNITKQGIMTPASLLQILPDAFANDPMSEKQFGKRFPTANDFINYLAKSQT